MPNYTQKMTRFAAIVSVISLAVAQNNTTAAEPPSPAPELKAALDPYVGKWTCTGRQEFEGEPARQIKFRKEASWELGGSWLLTKSDDIRTKKDEEPHMTFRSFAGFDPVTKKITTHTFFPGGGTLTATSSGWEGNKFTWVVELNMMGEKTPATHFFEKKSDTKTYDWVEMTGPDGKVKKVMEATCKKGK